MNGAWLRDSVVVARGEWVLHRREHGGVGGQRLRLVAIVAAAAVLGWGAYGIGREVATGETAPVGALGVATVAATAWIAWRSSRLARSSFEGLNPDFLLTAVPARVPAVGLVLFVAARIAAALAIPTVAVAVGGAIGLQAPLVAVTVVLAAGAVTAFAAAAGVAARLAAHLVATRLARGRTYRDLIVLLGWLPLVAGWLLLEELSGVPTGWLEAVPTVAVADLALLGAAERTGADPVRGLAVLTSLPGAALLAGTTTVLARWIWEGDTAESSPSSGSHPLIEAGWVEQLSGERLPRPVRTVARKRWLVERRAPRGLLYTGYVLFFVGVFLLPISASAGIPGFVVVALALGLATGIAFGSDPVGIEYRGLALVLTTVRGREFVGGILLAALAPALAVVPAVVLLLGVASGATPGEMLSFVLFGMATCGCTASLALAAGLGVDLDEFGPVPGFFTDVPWYAETGWAQFWRLGTVLVGATLSALPAFVGTHPAVYEPLVAAGVPVPATRSGALLLSALLAAGVTQITFGIAVERYEGYSLE